MSDSYSYVKIHNAQRRDKLERKKGYNLQYMTPPKCQYKHSLWEIYKSL